MKEQKKFIKSSTHTHTHKMNAELTNQYRLFISTATFDTDMTKKYCKLNFFFNENLYKYVIFAVYFTTQGVPYASHTFMACYIYTHEKYTTICFKKKNKAR